MLEQFVGVAYIAVVVSRLIGLTSCDESAGERHEPPNLAGCYDLK